MVGSVKILLPVACIAALASCTTLENRRDLYSPQKVQGPYTRMLRDGIPQPEPVTGNSTVTTGDYKQVVQ